MKPYVVSADIYLLLSKWAKQENFILPEKSYFEKIRREFSNRMLEIFPDFEFVSEEELVYGLEAFSLQSDVPIVSLDKVYSKSELHLDITRTVDIDGNDLSIQGRYGAPSIDEQIGNIKKAGFSKIALMDDVIFSGSLIERLIAEFGRLKVTVSAVYAGIGILEGVERIQKAGPTVSAVRQYEKALDVICERDFYPGIPYCGRSIGGTDNFCLPYLLPFAQKNLEKWSSIPQKHQESFSYFCIEQTIRMFGKIERCSNKAIMMEDLERKIWGQPHTGRFVEALTGLFNLERGFNGINF